MADSKNSHGWQNVFRINGIAFFTSILAASLPLSASALTSVIIAYKIFICFVLFIGIAILESATRVTVLRYICCFACLEIVMIVFHGIVYYGLMKQSSRSSQESGVVVALIVLVTLEASFVVMMTVVGILLQNEAKGRTVEERLESAEPPATETPHEEHDEPLPEYQLPPSYIVAVSAP